MVDYPVSRRTLIGSIGVAGAVASGAGGLTSASAAPAAIKPPIKPAVANGQAPGPATAQPRLEWVYDAVIQLQKEIPHGRTVRGERFRVPIIGGTFAGPTLSGKIISGGYYWQLLRDDGYFELSADYFMETRDGVAINVLNRGLWYSPTGDWPASYSVSSPQFEAPNGPYAWMNQRIFTGTIGKVRTADEPGVQLSIFQLLPG